MWGSFRRRLSNKQHILKQATKLGAGLLVGLRAIDRGTRIEAIFEEALVESLLNANGKGRLVEALRRAAYVVEIRGGRALKASGVA
jgi:hypothetical protein